MKKNYLALVFITLSFIFIFSNSFAIEVPIYDFSIKSYSQDINEYLPANSPDFSSPILTPEYQQAQLRQFYNHYYSSSPKGLSPWSAQLVKSVLPLVKEIELGILKDFDNEDKDAINRHYAENFKEHDALWLNRIRHNMHLNALDSTQFKSGNRAIAIANTYARALPDQAPDFYHFSLPGQGFPFDNLQDSAIWAGTPLYVIAVSRDKSWSLVLTPDAYFSWVKSNDIAYASNHFINQWQEAAEQGLIAITKTEASILDGQEQFQFTGYIGSVFPLVAMDESKITLLIPIKNRTNQAVVKKGLINKNEGGLMPLVASKQTMAMILKQLQNRPYGWGGAFFFNDCSQELKSLFAPFGIWLPRNSAKQAQMSATIDLSKNTLDERLSALKKQGHPLMTLIHIGGHVMLYVGTKEMANQDMEAIVYHNIWGMTPANKDKRYVIGQALFLPLLKEYPENSEINSLANKSLFKLTYLDALELNGESQQAFKRYFTKPTPVLN